MKKSLIYYFGLPPKHFTAPSKGCRFYFFSYRFPSPGYVFIRYIPPWSQGQIAEWLWKRSGKNFKEDCQRNRLGMEAQNTMEKCNWSHYYGSAAVYSLFERKKENNLFPLPNCMLFGCYERIQVGFGSFQMVCLELGYHGEMENVLQCKYILLILKQGALFVLLCTGRPSHKLQTPVHFYADFNGKSVEEGAPSRTVFSIFTPFLTYLQ